MRLRSLAPLALALVFCCACRRNKTEEVKKDEAVMVTESPEVPAPADLVLDLQLRDPERVYKAIADGLRPVGDPSEPSLEKLIDQVGDPDGQRALKALDPHGTLSLVVTMPKSGKSPQFAAAAVLRDPRAARDALAASAKADPRMVSTPNKALGTAVFDDGQGAKFAIVDRVAVLSNDVESLEASARYLAFRSTRSKPAHDLSLRVPSAFVPRLQEMAREGWEHARRQAAHGARFAAELERLVPSWIQAIGELGDVDLDLDVVGSELRFQQRVPARGALAAWFGAVPAGQGDALLALPRGDVSVVGWMPPGGGPLVSAAVDDSLDSVASLKPSEKAEVRKHVPALVGALGNRFGYTVTSVPGSTMSPATEMLLEVALTDPAAAKSAIAPLRKLLEKAGKLTVTPYKQHKAEGELLSSAVPSAGSAAGAVPAGTTWLWAIQDDRLLVDLCVGCKPSMVEAALDPASTGRWSADEVAKAKVAEFPKQRLTMATYGVRMPSLTSLRLLGASSGTRTPAESTPGYLWATSSTDGNTAKGAIPLSGLVALYELYPLLMMGLPY